MTVKIEVSWGELIDKVTILQIKLEEISDPTKRANIQRELEALTPAHTEAQARDPRIPELTAQLKALNKVIWDNEDRLRDLEREKRYEADFVACARTAYRTNDQRCAVKRTLNELLQSELMEEKSYAKYD